MLRRPGFVSLRTRFNDVSSGAWSGTGAVYFFKDTNQGGEIYSLLGNNDLMVSHLNSSISSLITEINQLLPGWHTVAIREGESSDYTNFPYFEVSKYYKVLGTTLDEESSKAFNNNIPEEDELLDLLNLGKNWDSNTITEARKQQFLEKRWLLGKTELVPGEINVITTIRLTSPEMGTDAPWKEFNQRILPYLLEKDIITSAYEGINHRANIDYLLRIKTKTDDLFQFLSELHTLGVSEEVLFTTNTYVIVNKWSSLSLEKSLPLSGLAHVDEYFRDAVILPLLETPHDKSKFKALGSSQQSYIVRTLRTIQRLLNEPNSKRSVFVNAAGNRKLMPDIVYGIFLKELKKLKPSHDEFLNAVEKLLNEILQFSSEDEVNAMIKNFGYKGKEKNRLTYYEKINVAMQIVRNSYPHLSTAFEESCKDLTERTVSIRNAFAHHDYERTSVEAYCQAMQSYAEFLKNWDAIELT
jgi:hypothetical protein